MLGERLKNIQSMFPFEATSAYVAIQGILRTQGIGQSERLWLMLGIAVLLAIFNIVLYARVKKMRNPMLHVFMIIGFFVWVINIDTARYEDLAYIGRDIEIISPVSLILYTTASGLVIPRGVGH